jgi:hypothetical protein
MEVVIRDFDGKGRRLLGNRSSPPNVFRSNHNCRLRQRQECVGRSCSRRVYFERVKGMIDRRLQNSRQTSSSDSSGTGRKRAVVVAMMKRAIVQRSRSPVLN